MVVFDTDLIIGLLRKNSDARRSYQKYENGRTLISSFTWYELMVGCCKVKNRRKQLEQVINCLGNTGIILIDDTIATIAARNAVALAQRGKPTGIVDTFIAASCIAKNDTLVTRNVKHFKRIPGLKVESW